MSNGTMSKVFGGSPLAVAGRLILVSILVGVVLAALGLGEFAGDLLPARLEPRDDRAPGETPEDPDHDEEAQDLGQDEFDVDQAIHACSPGTRTRVRTAASRLSDVVRSCRTGGTR